MCNEIIIISSQASEANKSIKIVRIGNKKNSENLVLNPLYKLFLYFKTFPGTTGPVVHLETR